MKKKHFYQSRIRVLSIILCFLVAGLTGLGVASSKASVNDIVKTVGVTTLFAPIAFVTKLKEKGVYDKLDDETKAFCDNLETAINDALKAAPTITKEQIAQLIKENGEGLTKEQMDAFKDTLKTVKTHAEWLEKNGDKGIEKETSGSPIMKMLLEHKEKLDDMKNWGKKGSLKMEIKAGGADQAATDIATHTIGLRVPGIGQIPTRRPFMTDLFNVVNTSLEYIKYIDQETVVRDAQNVASAAASTHTSKLTWKERSIRIVNIRDLVDVPIDMLQDYDFVEGELRTMLNVNVALKKDNGLLKGTGVYPELHSVDEVASEFDATNTLGGTIAAWNGTIQTPNFYDLVIAMTSQIISLGQDGSFIPNVILVNTVDRYKTMLIKDKNDNYLMPPFVVRVNNKDFAIDGMVVRSNPNVDANSCYVFDSSKGTIYQRKGAIAEMSFENVNNFEVEVVTMKVYERLNLLIRNINANAFMKCSDIQTALVALQAP
jgi:hypothetical protein